MEFRREGHEKRGEREGSGEEARLKEIKGKRESKGGQGEEADKTTDVWESEQET